MSSTSFLYHAYGLRDYCYRATQYVRGEIVFRICHNPASLRCGKCGSDDVNCRGQKIRTFTGVPIGKKKTRLELPVQRVSCNDCGAGPHQVKLGFADPLRSYTRAFERYALELSRMTTMDTAARHLGVSWDTIKDIQKRFLGRHFGKPKLKKLRRIGVDEIAVGKGHRYLTVVLNLDSGAVVFVGDGKGADALTPFWKRVKASRCRIEAVAMDMSAAYIEAVTRNLPDAAIVFDHFHVIKLYNEKLSDLRRELQRQAEDEQKKVLKGTRWLLLSNPDKLDKKPDQKKRLAAALELNKPLATAYYLKEELRLFWSQDDKATAGTFLDGWLARARASGLRMLEKMANTLESHKSGLLAYYDHPISNGPLEGTNNKIKTMQRQAYGFRDMEFFKLKILAIHLTEYALIG